MIILVGASASGKTEIAKRLCSDFGFSKVVTYTSRQKRPGEKNHVDYHFVTEEDFLRKRDKNFFLETTIYNGNYYGTSIDEIEINKVIIVDPNGLKSFRDIKDPTIVTFYLVCSEQTRIERMEKRGDPQEAIKERVENDKISFSYNKIGHIDFVIDAESSDIAHTAKDIYEKYAQKLANNI